MKHIKPFRLLESDEFKDRLVAIATNESNWSWEYDAVHIKATLYFDPTGSNNLYLHIRRTHIKTGIGAGEFPRDVVDYEPVGTINKPELKKIQTLLRENKYSPDRPFKRQWTDMKGEQRALGQIIKGSRYLKMVNLKNRLAKKHIPKKEPTEGINIMKYGKGYVVYGEGTRAIKDDLKNLGAKFNFRLKHPETGERFAGWIISPAKLDSAKELVGVTQIEESYSPEEIFNLKQEIKDSFSTFEIVRLFPKMYDEFFDIIVEDADLDYMKTEDPDELEFNFAEATQVYIWDYNSEEFDITFLKNYLKEKEFRISPLKKSYNDLDDNSKRIYDTLEMRSENIFWELLDTILGNM